MSTIEQLQAKLKQAEAENKELSEKMSGLVKFECFRSYYLDKRTGQPRESDAGSWQAGRYSIFGPVEEFQLLVDSIKIVEEGLKQYARLKDEGQAPERYSKDIKQLLTKKK